MAIPAFIRDPGIIVALITEFRFVLVTAHAGTIQIHGISFLVTRRIDSDAFPDDRFLPVLQEILVIDTDKRLRFYALLLVRGLFGLGYIAHFSAHRIIPERRGYQPEKDNQTRDDLAFVIHMKSNSFPLTLSLSPQGRGRGEGALSVLFGCQRFPTEIG
jgi:hypothetical protein